jgi:chorismate-pyruvate lyase
MNATNLMDDLAALCAPFFSRQELLRDAEACQADDIPDRPRQLLVHQEHMTTTLSGHYGGAVTLDVIRTETTATHYARYIRLREPRHKRIVEVGVMRMHLDSIPASVRDEVLAQRLPFGDIMIRHNILRRIETRGYLTFGPASRIVAAFENPRVDRAWARVGFLHCQAPPGVELFEAVC